MKRVSAEITHISWGKIEIDGVGSGRDYKLWPGGGRPWDWRETDTHHVPGIQIADIEELLKYSPDHLVLTRGMQLVLKTSRDTLEFLQGQPISIHQLETREAVALFNELGAQGHRVAGLFHSTC